MSPKQRRKSEYKIPGIIMLVALIAAALAFGIYGLQQAKQYLNTTAATPTNTTEGNITSTQGTSTQTGTPAQEVMSSASTSPST
ncbi:MAG: hypothetical protein J7L51_03450 [Desulfurococcales archaeon]|nr:hypothetical protein [Desulfurococcales archaeon]